MLVDCHSHLDSFTDVEVSAILERARQAGVGPVISAGTTVRSSARSVQLASTFPEIFSGVGIHPMDLKGPVDEETCEQLLKLAASSDKVIVMSEIGLDFMEGAPDRVLQYQAFRQQIRLARELKLPVVFHSREAHTEALRLLKEERAYEVGGAMHYFQADLATARRAIDLGFYVSLGRPLLRLPHLQEVSAAIALDHIVFETDAAPQPFKPKRDRWTEPRHIRDIAEMLAQLHGRDVDKVEEVTTRNVITMLGSNGAVAARHLVPKGRVS